MRKLCTALGIILLGIYSIGADFPAPNQIVFDGAGNLFGTTQNGGRFGFGNVFELTP